VVGAIDEASVALDRDIVCSHGAARDVNGLHVMRRLDGLPKEAVENEKLLPLILPALRADAALYRRYVYTESPPLACPIRAYGGDADPNVTVEHLEAWRSHTACSFAFQIFPGGHFFYQRRLGEFLQALGRDVLA